MPKFMGIAKEYSGCLPIIVADVNQFPRAADLFRVQSTPTMMITRYGRRGFAGFIDGDASEERIRNLFTAAANGLDCQV
jgi:thioredoxin-like negative regulator of GroEL